MSYDVKLSVKVEGTDKYITVREPELSSPTYNLDEMFKACMDWDFDISSGDTNYFPCDFVIVRIEHGLKELASNMGMYKAYYEPDNGWGCVDTAIQCLRSWHDEIYRLVEETEVSLEHIYFSWV